MPVVAKLFNSIASETVPASFFYGLWPSSRWRAGRPACVSAKPATAPVPSAVLPVALLRTHQLA